MALSQEANNIIQGPWVTKTSAVDPNITITENGVTVTVTGVSLIKHNHICETLMAVVPLLFNNIELAGFSIDPENGLDETVKDGTLVVEAVKSLLCKHYGIYHPLQDVADALLIEHETKGFEFAERLDLDLDPLEPMIAFMEEDDNGTDVLED